MRLKWLLLLLPTLLLGHERFSAGICVDATMDEPSTSVRVFPTPNIFVQGFGSFYHHQSENFYQIGGRIGFRSNPDGWIRPYAGFGFGQTRRDYTSPPGWLPEVYQRRIVFLGASVLPLGRKLPNMSIEAEIGLLNVLSEWYEGWGWCWDFYQGSLSFPWPGLSIHFNF